MLRPLSGRLGSSSVFLPLTTIATTRVLNKILHVGLVGDEKVRHPMPQSRVTETIAFMWFSCKYRQVKSDLQRASARACLQHQPRPQQLLNRNRNVLGLRTC